MKSKVPDKPGWWWGFFCGKWCAFEIVGVYDREGKRYENRMRKPELVGHYPIDKFMEWGGRCKEPKWKPKGRRK